MTIPKFSAELDEPKVAAGIRICDAAAVRVGILGAILARNTDDALLGVTALQVASSESIFIPDLGIPIGERDSAVIYHEPMQGAYPLVRAAVALIRIRSTVSISGRALPDTRSIGITSPVGALGQPVRKLALSGASTVGILSGVECPVHLRSKSTRTVKTYVGACEITWSDSDQPFSGPGDAGAPVVNERGELIGIVIGGARNRCFVAPLDQMIKETNTRLADRGALTKHNSVALKVGSRSAPRIFPAHAEAQSRGLSSMIELVTRKITSSVYKRSAV
jgi:hypothetical protein